MKKTATKSVSQIVHIATPAKARHNGVLKKASLYSEEKVWAVATKIPAPPQDLFEPQISETAHYIGQTRYARRNEKGEPVETDKEMFWRVAYSIACADLLYEGDIEKMVSQARKFYAIMASQQYIPNTPTMLNAGKAEPQMSACFVLPIDDNMRSIGETMVDMALIHKSGGGTGFSFSRLRPYGDIISTSGGKTVGPCAFLQAYNDVTSQVKQGGVRRGANMGIMHITHPDVLRFAVMKVDEFNLTNFNISVTVTEKWMEQVEKDRKFVTEEPQWDDIIEEIKLAQQIRDVDLKLKKTEDGVVKLYDLVKAGQEDEGYELINPRNGEVTERLNAYKVFLLITKLAWQYGDPGMILIDRINASGANPTPHLGQIESTNPCVVGETLISTAEGLISMKEVVESHFEGGKRFGGNMALIIDSRSMDQTSLGTLPGRAVKFFDNDIKEVLKLTTKSGFELVATLDHQLLTQRGWVKLCDLQVEDRVMIQSGNGSFGKDYSLPFTSSGNLPNQWSKELGQTLGWLIGDGWIRTGDKNCRVGFTFGKEDQQIMMYLQGIINSWYGRDIKVVKRLRNTFHLSYHGKRLIDFFLKLGVKSVKADNKEVPETIFTAPEEAVIGFIQGLFTSDGTVGIEEINGTKYVRLTSKSRQLLQGVQLLLLNLGILSTIYNRSRKPRNNMFPYTDIYGNKKTYTTDGVLYELQISRDNIPLFLKKIGFLFEKHKQKVNNLLSYGGYYKSKFEDQVASIVPTGKQRVYDLTEERSLTFITNGIVSLDCGEQPLLPYDACTLGSINVGKFVEDGKIDFEALSEVTKEAIHFLDNVLDMNNYPIPEIKEMTRKIRRVGLGVMGFADLLYKLGIGYNTEEGLKVAEEMMAHIQKHAKLGSVKLARVRGVFPVWHGSIFDPQSPYFRGEELHIRNSAVTTIAPTGTIAMLADASSGIEPYFALSYAKNTIEGKRLFNVNPFFLEIAKKEGFYSEDLLGKIEANGSVQGLAEVPETWQKVFVTTKDISPDWHVRMQAAFQKQVDNAISKTINFPYEATVDDVRRTYMMVYETGCKGITIYRDGSRTKQILEVKKEGSYYDQLAGKDTKPRVSLNGRPVILRGRTYKITTPVGEAFITVNRDETEEPFEVFLTIGKAGMHIAADAEAIGRLTSLALRVSRPNSKEVARKIVNQLRGIGGASQVGFGKDRVMSLADGVAKVLAEDLALNEDRSEEQTSEPIPLNLEEGKSVVTGMHADLCPSCGQPTFVFEEGCKKCESCGYSVC